MELAQLIICTRESCEAMAARSAAEKLVLIVVEDLQARDVSLRNVESTLISLVDLLSSSQQPLSLNEDTPLSHGHQSNPLHGFYECYLSMLAQVTADGRLNEGESTGFDMPAVCMCSSGLLLF